MKIVYNIPSVIACAGMERVLANKANYLADKMGMEVVIVTTDQQGYPPVFPFSDKIRFIDLNIGYKEQKKKIFFLKALGKSRCEQRHKKALEELLLAESPDVTISMMLGKEKMWLPKMKDSSKKILEYHFCKPALVPRHWLSWGHWLKYWKLLRVIRMYDKFVVLTEEDKSFWGQTGNIEAIPNALTFSSPQGATLSSRRVLAVGRLAKQKGFDYLIDIWAKVHQVCPDWQLSIIGTGPEQTRLQRQIMTLNLQSSVEILPPTAAILEEYMQSSVFVMTSRYEGMAMVLIEAMECGLPVVAYACKCGPKDVIQDQADGFLIEEGEQENFAEKLILLMKDGELRERFGQNAKQHISRFGEEKVMEKWRALFISITEGV